MAVEGAAEGAVLEEARSEVATASAAPVDKLVAFEDVAPEAVDAEVGAVEDAGSTETAEVAADPAADASACRPPAADCRWVGWACKRS